MSGRAIASAMTDAGFSVSGRSVSQFINGHTAGLPRWADNFRAWRDALPPAAPSPPSPSLFPQHFP